jgi:hypothetical protein
MERHGIRTLMVPFRPSIAELELFARLAVRLCLSLFVRVACVLGCDSIPGKVGLPSPSETDI